MSTTSKVTLGTHTLKYNNSNYVTFRPTSDGKFIVDCTGSVLERQDGTILATTEMTVEVFKKDFECRCFPRDPSSYADFYCMLSYSLNGKNPIIPYICWSKVDEGDGNVKFELKYIMFEGDSRMPDTTVDTIIRRVPEAIEILYKNPFREIDVSSFISHPIYFYGRITRVIDSDNTYTGSILLHFVGVEYSPNKLGT
jgi:hypothetical protein